jgi:hypothetical protein
MAPQAQSEASGLAGRLAPSPRCIEAGRSTEKQNRPHASAHHRRAGEGEDDTQFADTSLASILRDMRALNGRAQS